MKRPRILAKLPPAIGEIRLSAEVHRALAGQMRSCEAEIAGGLYGVVEQRDILVLAARPASTHDNRVDSFTMSLDELLRPGEGPLSLLGIYHSHPREQPELSSLDYHYFSLARWIWLLLYARPDDDPGCAFYAKEEGRVVRVAHRIDIVGR